MFLIRLFIRLIRLPFDIVFLTIDFFRIGGHLVIGKITGGYHVPFGPCLQTYAIEGQDGSVSGCGLSRKYGNPELVCLLCRKARHGQSGSKLAICGTEGSISTGVFRFLGTTCLLLLIWGAVLGGGAYVYVDRYGNPLEKKVKTVAEETVPEPIHEPDAKARAADWLKEAEAAMAAGSFSDAQRGFEKATELDAGNIQAFIGLARTSAQANLMGRATDAIEHALKLGPENIDALIWAADIFRQVSNNGRALECATQAVALDGTNFEALLQLVRAQRANGDADASRTTAQRLIASKPDDPRGTMEVASIALNSGDLVAAERGFRRTIDLEPDLLGARIGLAQVLGARGDLDGAINSLRALSLQQPGKPEPRMELAEMLLRKGLSGQAIAEFEKLTTEYPEKFALRSRLGELLAQTGRVEESYLVLQQLLKDNPGDPIAHMVFADLFLRRGFATLADEHVEKALAQLPRDARAYRLRARIVMAQGNTDNAIRILRVLLDHLPQDIELRMRLALCLAKQGEAEEAEKELLRASRLRPENPAPYIQLAQLYVQAHRYGDAVQQYRTLVERTPGNAGAWNNMALALLDNGSPVDEAVTAARKAHDLVPDDPRIVDTLAWCLFKAGQTTEAAELSARAARELARAGGIRYHNALILAEIGQTDKALEELEAALGTEDAFPGRDEAEKLLSKMKNGAD